MKSRRQKLKLLHHRRRRTRSRTLRGGLFGYQLIPESWKTTVKGYLPSFLVSTPPENSYQEPAALPQELPQEPAAPAPAPQDQEPAAAQEQPSAALPQEPAAPAPAPAPQEPAPIGGTRRRSRRGRRKGRGRGGKGRSRNRRD